MCSEKATRTEMSNVKERPVECGNGVLHTDR